MSIGYYGLLTVTMAYRWVSEGRRARPKGNEEFVGKKLGQKNIAWQKRKVGDVDVDSFCIGVPYFDLVQVPLHFRFFTCGSLHVRGDKIRAKFGDNRCRKYDQFGRERTQRAQKGGRKLWGKALEQG